MESCCAQFSTSVVGHRDSRRTTQPSCPNFVSTSTSGTASDADTPELLLKRPRETLKKVLPILLARQVTRHSYLRIQICFFSAIVVNLKEDVYVYVLQLTTGMGGAVLPASVRACFGQGLYSCCLLWAAGHGRYVILVAILTLDREPKKEADNSPQQRT